MTSFAKRGFDRLPTFRDAGGDVGAGAGQKARVGRYLIVVPGAKRAATHSRGIVAIGEGDMALGPQPTAIRSSELVEWSALDHRRFPGQ
jgi:hypothetical protein